MSDVVIQRHQHQMQLQLLLRCRELAGQVCKLAIMCSGNATTLPSCSAVHRGSEIVIITTEGLRRPAGCPSLSSTLVQQVFSASQHQYDFPLHHCDDKGFRLIPESSVGTEDLLVYLHERMGSPRGQGRASWWSIGASPAGLDLWDPLAGMTPYNNRSQTNDSIESTNKCMDEVSMLSRPLKVVHE